MKTSYYANLERIDRSKFEPVAISGDEGKMVNFEGRALRKLSPYTFFRKWKEKEDWLDEEFNNGRMLYEDYKTLKHKNEQDYIQMFYNKVLKPLNPQSIYNELGENAVMLCFEKPTKFCHRFLVSGWLELNLGVKIDEYGFENDKEVQKNKERLKREIKIHMENNLIKGKDNE